jgi:hypothetical protein
MRTDIMTLDTPTADDQYQYLPDLHRHPLSIHEIEAAGWGAAWQPDAALCPTWLEADDCLRDTGLLADPGVLQPPRAADP